MSNIGTVKKVSPFSATMIGIHDKANSNQDVKEAFRREAREIQDYTKGVHHARKIAHIQVNYPYSVEKLSKLQAEVPTTLLPPRQEAPMRMSEFRVTKEREFMDSMKSSVQSETFINQRKRYYNREVGRKAVVNEILKGTAPPSTSYIFPQKASHEQILAMTGTLKAPNANIVPPAIPRTKKWLGDNVGWES